VEDLEYYTKPQGLEKEPKLTAALVPVLHKFVVTQKLSPIKIAMYLQDNLKLVENSKSLVKVMELLVESNVKSSEMNEVLAMKLHYLAFMLKKCARWHEGLEGKDGIDGFIKFLTKGRPSDGFFLNVEDLIRQAIKEFEYPDCTIFKQLVQTIAPVAKGFDPTALAVLTQSINGLRCADFSDCCGVCTENRNVKKCSACKMVGYCGVSCQKLHWHTHKKFCKQLAKDYEKQLAAKLEEEKLEEMNNIEKENPSQINGENKSAVNGEAEETLNCENSETNDSKTASHEDVSETKHEPTDKQTSGVPLKKS